MSTFLLLSAITLSVGVAYLLGKALVTISHRYVRFALDHPGTVQKFHSDPVPRIGGIAIYLAVLAAWAVVPASGARSLLGVLVLTGLPAFGIGLVEDLTKRIGVLPRLFLTVASGVLASVTAHVAITRTGVPIADPLLGYWPLAVLFTGFAVGGVANAINIIDGFNGLASGTVTISLIALAVIAIAVGDHSLAIASVLVAAALTGFMVVNFPWGRLFLGDGGAYFSGFALAWFSVELLARNPAVSPWAAFLLCCYPTVEVMYSIVRRRVERRSPGSPDRAHLHSLVATQLVQPRLMAIHPSLRNSAVSLVMWMFALLPAVPAAAFYDRPDILVPWMVGFVVFYHLVYRRLSPTTTPEELPEVETRTA